MTAVGRLPAGLLLAVIAGATAAACPEVHAGELALSPLTPALHRDDQSAGAAEATARDHVARQAVAAGAPTSVATIGVGPLRDGIRTVRVEQRLAGLPVIGTDSVVTLDRAGRVRASAGALLGDRPVHVAAGSRGPTPPAVTPRESAAPAAPAPPAPLPAVDPRATATPAPGLAPAPRVGAARITLGRARSGQAVRLRVVRIPAATARLRVVVSREVSGNWWGGLCRPSARGGPGRCTTLRQVTATVPRPRRGTATVLVARSRPRLAPGNYRVAVIPVAPGGRSGPPRSFRLRIT